MVKREKKRNGRPMVAPVGGKRRERGSNTCEQHRAGGNKPITYGKRGRKMENRRPEAAPTNRKRNASLIREADLLY
jgi:hypothetical protein